MSVAFVGPLHPLGWVKFESEADLEARANAKEAKRRKTSEMRRLSAFIDRGGKLSAEDVPGLGTLWRSRCCSTAPFSPDVVERWEMKHKRSVT